jgi:excinuclease UvrABC nuclease subunit
VTGGIEVHIDEKVLERLESIPSSSGCYAVVSDDDEILFVDEVDDLKSRFHRHFSDPKVLDQWRTAFGYFTVRYLIAEAASGSRQALAVRLIDQYQPAFNVRIRRSDAPR